MIDKQQIEELKEALNKYAIAFGKSFEDAYGEYAVARKLIDFGMLPLLLPENAVVLTREEFDRLNSCIKSEEEIRAIMQQQMLPMVRQLAAKETDKKLADITALACKETTKKCFKEFKEICDLFFNGKIDCCEFMSRYYNLAKQLGVEVD